LLPRNYFAGNLKKNSTFERFMKNKSYIEEINREMEARCSIMTQKGLLQKSKNPRSFNLLVFIICGQGHTGFRQFGGSTHQDAVSRKIHQISLWCG